MSDVNIDIYIFIYYTKNGGTKNSCFVLAVGSVSHGSSAKRSFIFLKMSKPNHVKNVIFKKHFCRI